MGADVEDTMAFVAHAAFQVRMQLDLSLARYLAHRVSVELRHSGQIRVMRLLRRACNLLKVNIIGVFRSQSWGG